MHITVKTFSVPAMCFYSGRSLHLRLCHREGLHQQRLSHIAGEAVAQFKVADISLVMPLGSMVQVLCQRPNRGRQRGRWQRIDSNWHHIARAGVT